MHLGEFLRYGYKPSPGACEVRFVHDGSRVVEKHSVSLVDGFTKILIMCGVVAMVSELDFNENELKTLQPILKSFISVKCSYTHYEQASMHYLHGLRSLQPLSSTDVW